MTSDNLNGRTWKSVLDYMANGNILISKHDIKSRQMPFLWRCSVINKSESSIFSQTLTACGKLPTKQNYKTYQGYFDQSHKKSVVSFLNLSGDTVLVVPVPTKTKNFATIQNFINNASIKQQSDLWKLVAKEVRNMLESNDYVWISTHGLGVPYLHIRICNYPKYYGRSMLSNIS
jgi:hypothetical protein